MFFNRHNTKYFIRIFVGFVLTYIVNQLLQLTHAAPSSTKLFNEQVNSIEQLKNCTDPAIDEFPNDIFTQSQRQHGAIIIHLLACIYIFIAIALLVNDYFIASLDKICSTLNLDEDVAGATFMAGGSSSPELFTSIIGIFVAKGDVGMGTIVGSAVFNIVCVIGICGLFVNGAVRLTWWPLCRDSVYYSLSIIFLITCLSDGRITLFDSMILLFLYIGYIIIMCYNKKIQVFIEQKWQYIQRFNAVEEPIINSIQTQKTYGMTNLYQRFNRENESTLMDFETAALRMMMSRHFRRRTRFQMAVRFVISQMKDNRGQGINRPEKPVTEQRFSIYKGRTPSLLALNEVSDDWKTMPNFNYNPIGCLKWFIMFPIKFSFYYTVPDCRISYRLKWYPLTFIMSIVWLSILTYFMIWMVTIIGFTFGIPDSVMGITFLAAGSSIPDALSSILVVRQGLVDMGVSNTFGSNVFDLLVGLALPWFFKTLLSGEPVHINSNGLRYDSILLLGIVVITVLSFHGRNWYLDRFLGVFFLGVYGIFVIFSLLIELNVFGFVNPPMCPI